MQQFFDFFTEILFLFFLFYLNWMYFTFYHADIQPTLIFLFNYSSNLQCILFYIFCLTFVLILLKLLILQKIPSSQYFLLFFGKKSLGLNYCSMLRAPIIYYPVILNVINVRLLPIIYFKKYYNPPYLLYPVDSVVGSELRHIS